MSDTMIKIKAVKKAPAKITIRRKLLSARDLKSMTHNILRLNEQAPLQQSTLQDLFEQTTQYMSSLTARRPSLIRIKKVRLFK